MYLYFSELCWDCSICSCSCCCMGCTSNFPALLELSCFSFRGCTSTSPSAPGTTIMISCFGCCRGFTSTSLSASGTQSLFKGWGVRGGGREVASTSPSAPWNRYICSFSCCRGCTNTFRALLELLYLLFFLLLGLYEYIQSSPRTAISSCSSCCWGCTDIF